MAEYDPDPYGDDPMAWYNRDRTKGFKTKKDKKRKKSQKVESLWHPVVLNDEVPEPSPPGRLDEQHIPPLEREVPPRRDREVKDGVLNEIEPTSLYPRELPAPPDMALWVAGDIFADVKMYAERREAEKRHLFPTFQRGATERERAMRNFGGVGR